MPYLKIIYEKWWKRNHKVISIVNYSEAWKESGNKPCVAIRTNGARKRKGDRCLDVSITIGYIVINYVNFSLQGK